MLRLLFAFIAAQAVMGWWVANHGIAELKLLYASVTTFLCLLVALEVVLVVQPRKDWERARGSRAEARARDQEPENG